LEESVDPSFGCWYTPTNLQGVTYRKIKSSALVLQKLQNANLKYDW